MYCDDIHLCIFENLRRNSDYLSTSVQSVCINPGLDISLLISADFCAIVLMRKTIFKHSQNNFPDKIKGTRWTQLCIEKGYRHLVSAYSAHNTWFQHKGNDGNSMVAIFSLTIVISMNQDTSGIKYWNVFKEPNYIYSPLRYTHKNSHD